MAVPVVSEKIQIIFSKKVNKNQYTKNKHYIF